MGAPEGPRLSDAQLALLRVLWEAGEATVAEVQAAVARTRPVALTTVATQLDRLCRRGVVARRREGRQFVYRAAVREADVRRSMVGALMARLFEGDAAALVHHLVAEGRIDAEELGRIRRRIAAAKRRRGARDEP